MMTQLAMSTAPNSFNLATGHNTATVDQLLALWTNGKSPRTAAMYIRVSRQFLEFVQTPIQWLTLTHLQDWVATLGEKGLKTSSQRTYISVVKSLLTFVNRMGLTAANVGAAVVSPKSKDSLAQKILGEGDVIKMIALESNSRNQLMLKTLYYAALRASELVDLTWGDLTPNGESGQLTVYGKGAKTRQVLIPSNLYRDLITSRGDAADSDPIFTSRKGKGKGKLTRQSVTQLVKDAAIRAGLSEATSAHWLRHSHASHSLDRGAPISLVQQTLGHSSVATTGKYLHAKPNQSSALFLV